jgi:hypothetical protein
MTMTMKLDPQRYHRTGGVPPEIPASWRDEVVWSDGDAFHGDDYKLEDALMYLKHAIQRHGEGQPSMSWATLQLAAGCATALMQQTDSGGRRPELTPYGALVLAELPAMLVQLITRVEAAEQAATRRKRQRR